MRLPPLAILAALLLPTAAGAQKVAFHAVEGLASVNHATTITCFAASQQDDDPAGFDILQEGNCGTAFSSGEVAQGALTPSGYTVTGSVVGFTEANGGSFRAQGTADSVVTVTLLEDATLHFDFLVTAFKNEDGNGQVDLELEVDSGLSALPELEISFRDSSAHEIFDLELPAETYEIRALGFVSAAAGQPLAGLVPGDLSGSYTLEVTVVPEPRASSALAAGAVLLAGLRARRVRHRGAIEGRFASG